jgi:hypothetical protein
VGGEYFIRTSLLRRKNFYIHKIGPLDTVVGLEAAILGLYILVLKNRLGFYLIKATDVDMVE